jgi:uridylate kinase
VLIKVSGEALCTPGGFGIDPSSLDAFVTELLPVCEMGVQIGLVVGGGNISRGKKLADAGIVERPTADAIGMLATVMNALALGDALAGRGVKADVMSARPTADVCEAFSRQRAIEHMEAGRVVILAGGTGNPFFTTDTCAALRACEIGAEVLLKATKVDGVFDADPADNPDAKKFDRITYGDVLTRQLGVMDLSAVSMCMESGIPVIVFRMDKPGNLASAVAGENVGTIISDGEKD